MDAKYIGNIHVSFEIHIDRSKMEIYDGEKKRWINDEARTRFESILTIYSSLLTFFFFLYILPQANLFILHQFILSQ